MAHISINERILQAQYHKKEQRIKELELLVSEYKESFETMKEHITELKELNKILTNQIYFLSHKNAS